jgi:ketosteroid isomerase-like protein
MVDSWIRAWSSKDSLRYGGFYAKDFTSNGKNLQQYLKYKEGLNRKYKSISVKKEKMSIDVGTRTSTVSFVQTYESSGYKAVGSKQLVLKKEGSQWKIYRENWKSL